MLPVAGIIKATGGNLAERAAIPRD